MVRDDAGPMLRLWRAMVRDNGDPPRFSSGQQLSNDVEVSADALEPQLCAEGVTSTIQELAEPRAPRTCAGCVSANFSMLTMLGCLVGLAVGYGARAAEMGEEGILLLGYVGELFVRSLKAPLSPMIFCSMICCTNLHAHTSSTRAPKLAIFFYAMSTVLASTAGIMAFLLLRPGSHAHLDASLSELSAEEAASEGPNAILDSLLELGREIVPDNMLKAMVEMKLLSVISAGVAVGVAIRHTAPIHPEATAPLLAMSKGVFEALLVLVGWLVMAAPIGVMSMVAACVAATPDLASVASGLGMFLLASLAGMLFHVLASLSLMLWLAAPATWPHPWRYLLGISPAASMAFGTASSAATLATTMECVAGQGVRRDVAAFVLPLGATVNMDGSAIGITVSVLYLANASGQLAAMNALDIANVGLISALLSVGAAPVPSSGLITLILCMDATGVRVTPLTAYVLAIDWLTDRMRTAVNVLSDAFVCAAVDRVIRRREPPTRPVEAAPPDAPLDAGTSGTRAARGGEPVAGAPGVAPAFRPLPALPTAAAAFGGTELAER